MTARTIANTREWEGKGRPKDKEAKSGLDLRTKEERRINEQIK